MIKLLVISNMKSKELGTFLAQRGTFDIYKCYDSLSDNTEDLQNSIVKVDKTLYLYQLDENGDSNINVRSDMQLLQRMILGNSFFNPGEIIFMTQAGQQGRQAERYFISVMEECQYKNYTVQVLNERISFSKIYSSLMGITESIKFSNTYRALYRAERGEESTTAYEKKNEQEVQLEPFSFENLKKYEEQKEITTKAVSSMEIQDLTANELRYFNSPNFHKINLNRNLLYQNISVVTGKSKSGLSTWSAALAISAAFMCSNALLLDFTSNQDLELLLKEGAVDYHYKRMKEMLSKQFEPQGLTLCSIKNSKEFSVRMDFLQYLFSTPDNGFSQVIIAVSDYDLEEIFSALRGNIGKIFLTVVPRFSDVLELQKYIKLLDKENVTILMNESISLIRENYLTKEEVYELLPMLKPRVVNSVTFHNLNVKGNLFTKLLKE